VALRFVPNENEKTEAVKTSVFLFTSKDSKEQIIFRSVTGNNMELGGTLFLVWTAVRSRRNAPPDDSSQHDDC
jgi:hypothetical protein